MIANNPRQRADAGSYRPVVDLHAASFNFFSAHVTVCKQIHQPFLPIRADVQLTAYHTRASLALFFTVLTATLIL